MSDFLTNLITRSATLEPAIRPRLVSLYEPPPVSLPVFAKEVDADGPALRNADTGDVRPEPSANPLLAPPLRRPPQPRDPPRFEPEVETLGERTRTERTAPFTLSDPTPLRVESQPEPETHESIARPIAETQVIDDQPTPVRETRLVAESVEIVSERHAPATATPSSSITPTAPPVEPPEVRSFVHSNPEDPSQPRVESFIERQQPAPSATNEQNRPTPEARESATPIIELTVSTSPTRLQVPEEKRTAKEVTAIVATVEREATPIVKTVEREATPIITTVEREATPIVTTVEREVSPIVPAVEREVTISEARPTHAPDRAIAPPVSVRNLVQPLSVRPAWRASEQDHDESPSEPTIQVTIGRVEVRGVVEETKKSKPRQSQSMSLDEYLRQRVQGAKQ